MDFGFDAPKHTLQPLDYSAMKLAEALAKPRYVRCLMFYAAARDTFDENGVVLSQDYSQHLIAPPFLHPEKEDELDTSDLESLRTLWLMNLKNAEDADPALEEFVREAKFPVPSDYKVILPISAEEKGLRRDIIGTLVPFKETRAMLLRAEDNYALPIRELEIGQVPVNSPDKIDELVMEMQGATIQ